MNPDTSSSLFHLLSSALARPARWARGVPGLGLCALLAGCGPDMLPAEDEAATLSTQTSNLYVASSKTWTTTDIPVCWENPSSGNATQRGWVRSAVAGTWDAQSAVNFTGWGTCTSSSNGIRIKISDEGPHTKGLGKSLDGYVNGMVLNFTFQNWSTSCQSQKEFCIRAIAVHEFGHALGFAHEQNRPDTPSSCTEPAQGSNGDTLIGPWDLSSVMNYCNPNWNGNGNLSVIDIAGVQTVYGKSQDVGVIPASQSCPTDSELISIYMDDEDSNNANSHSGWIGATNSTSNTRFYFCRTRGDAFKPLTTTSNSSKVYAVLKLGQQCPTGSVEFSRYFDNEDSSNNNSWYASISSNISPNSSTSNTRLVFCLFTTGSQTMSGFPNLGINYGVFAASNLSGALSTGTVHTDDEDSSNNNSYTVDSSYSSLATAIVSSGKNTDIRMARVK